VDNHRHVTNTTAIYEERKLLTIEPTKCHWEREREREREIYLEDATDDEWYICE
jgi:hypothetical protein